MVFRTSPLLILLLCAFTCVAGGDVTRDEVLTLKKLSGSSISRAGDEVLEVDEQEVGRSRRNFDAVDLNNNPDHSVANLAEENALVVTLKAEMTGKVETTPKTNPIDNSAEAIPPPPPLESKSNTTTPTTFPPPPPASKSDSGKAPPAHGGACDHGPVISSLESTGGEDGLHKYTLTVKNVGKSKLNVTIQTSNGWEATPAQLGLSKGENKTVTVSVTDNEAVRHAAKLDISWSDGDCYVDIPAQTFAQDVPSDVDRSSYSAFLNAPGTAALLLGGSLVFLVVLGVAGVWGCISWRAHARRHGDMDTKYQELEMAATDTKLGDEEQSPSADGWDEVWEDDDWEDTEAARTSSTTVTLSSAGLNSRRANKDGWDSSWDD